MSRQITGAGVFSLAVASALLGVLGGILIGHARGAVPPLSPRYTQRQELLQHMKADPSQPWPRSIGHVVLAWPGSRLDQKGYLEPGGSFSPGVGSFGILIQAGNFISSTIPLKQIKQSMDSGLGITTESPYYSADWTVESPRSFLLKLQARMGLPLSLLLRSDGPAGGPLSSITWDKGVVLVNGIWRIEAAGSQQGPALGKPLIAGSGNWLRATVPLGSVRVIRVTTLIPLADPVLFPAKDKLSELRSLPQVNVPDVRFSASMGAQERHLLMSLVGNETRPGDPVNYPLAWNRDGAYEVTALARSGEIATAEKLALFFARHDWFGGFGPEADTPGLSLWAIGQTADRAHDPAFDREVWPDVYRKAEMILKMIHTTRAIYRIPYGPIVPADLNRPDLDLVCGPAKNGLIVGRMDFERPLLYVNGVSYAGLRAAARIALRQPGGAVYAKLWDQEASVLRKAWWRALSTPQREDDRSAIVGLWPSNIANNDPIPYSSLLKEHWDKTHDPTGNFKSRPLWTYFKVAEAHEWLLEGEARVPDARTHVWQTLNWFWDHQSSPGLYTWWEGRGEENSFGLWQEIRGWEHPGAVTPHYWTAAEMLSLQLDMLVHEDEDGSLVIGLGVPNSWLAHPMHVSGIVCPRGTVAWSWDGHHLKVLLNGQPVTYIPGPAFRGILKN